MKHIAFITGSADFLNLYSYLQHHGIVDDSIGVVLFGNARNIPEDLKRATKKLTDRLPHGSFYFLDSDQGVEGVSTLKEQIAAYPRSASPTNLFITHVFGRFENLILDTFDYEKLILVENGLATYFPPTGRDPQLERDYYRAEPNKHVHEAWLPLAQFIGRPFYLSKDTVNSPSIQGFRGSALDLSSETRIGPLKGEANEEVMFVAGTSLYRLGVLSQSDEIESYAKFILEAAETGADRIYWKPHPRMSVNPNTMSSISPKVTTLLDSMPLEFHFLNEIGARVSCASIASSSLLLGRYFFDVEPRLIQTGFAKESRYPHLSVLWNLIH
jgi:hypothetical protein